MWIYLLQPLGCRSNIFLQTKAKILSNPKNYLDDLYDITDFFSSFFFYKNSIFVTDNKMKTMKTNFTDYMHKVFTSKCPLFSGCCLQFSHNHGTKSHTSYTLTFLGHLATVWSKKQTDIHKWKLILYFPALQLGN